MKKIYVFLCLAVFLFLGSCSMSVSDEEARKADLPSDFKWKDYAEINNDVAMSQIVMDVRKTKREADSVENCANILSDNMNFAKEVYSKYLQCPVAGWDKKEKCPGKYAYNSSYIKEVEETTYVPKVIKVTDTTETENGPVYTQRDSTVVIKVTDTTETESGPVYTQRDSTVMEPKITLIPSGCVIGACWSEGWSEDKFSEEAKTGSGAVKFMCQFIPYGLKPEAAKNYLEKFDFDSTLIEQHYAFFGRYDGRPYKYCENQHGVERDTTLADKRGTYLDYGRHTFCLDTTTTDQKIYVVK